MLLAEISIWEKMEKTYEIVSGNEANVFIKYMALWVAIIPLLGVAAQLILSYKMNKKNQEFQEIWEKKKIDADIVSKSRMEWIADTKNISTRFISNALSLGAHNVMFNQKIQQYNKEWAIANDARVFSEDTKKPQKKRDEAKLYADDWFNRRMVLFDDDMFSRVSVMNDLIKDIYKDFLLIKMNFSDNTENNKIVGLAFEINEELRIFSVNNGWSQFDSDLSGIVDEALRIRDSNAEKVLIFSEMLRNYYKKEWERVKKGE